MTHETATRYPLSWPAGWQRTPGFKRRHSQFTKGGSAISLFNAIDRLQGELDRLGARESILSTNVRTKLNGLPYSNEPEPTDRGVAVYFKLKGKDRCLACDAFTTVAGNVAALAAHIDAIRRIDRYGVGTIDQAFAGYTALPAPAADWRSTFGLVNGASLDDVERKYREMARTAHPDAGGNDADMARLNVAIESARAELGAS